MGSSIRRCFRLLLTCLSLTDSLTVALMDRALCRMLYKQITNHKSESIYKKGHINIISQYHIIIFVINNRIGIGSHTAAGHNQRE